MKRSRFERLASGAALLMFSVLAVLPIVGIVVTAFNPPGALMSGFTIPTDWSLANFANAWTMGGFDDALASSAIIAVGTVAVTTVVSTLAGFTFGVLKFRGRDLVFKVFLIGLVVPPEAVVIPLYYDVQAYVPWLAGTYWVMILAESGLYIAFGTFWMRTCFRALGDELVGAARVDGASNWRILRSVLIPLVRPPLASLMILTFIWSWNEFLLPLVMYATTPENQTAPVGLARFTSEFTQDVPGIAAGAVLVAAPVIILYVMLQRNFIRGIVGGALDG